MSRFLSTCESFSTTAASSICLGVLDVIKNVIIQKPADSGSAFGTTRAHFQRCCLPLWIQNTSSLLPAFKPTEATVMDAFMLKSARGRPLEADTVHVPPQAALHSPPELDNLHHAIVAGEAFTIPCFFVMHVP